MFNRNEIVANNIIFIDVDDTLADTRKGVRQLYTEITGDESGDVFTKSKVYADFCPQWDNDKVVSLFKSNSSTLYSRVEPMYGAVDAIKKLEEIGYDIRIVTMHIPDGIPAKQMWIDKHFPTLSKKVYYKNFVGGNKDVFNGLAIVDDDESNVITNQNKHPILLDVYRIYDGKKFRGVTHLHTWQEVVDYFKNKERIIYG